MFAVKHAKRTWQRCLQGVVWRAGLLGHILEEALQPQEQAWPLPITAADLSSSLLTRLQGMLHHYSLQGGPRGQCHQKCVSGNTLLGPLHTSLGILILHWGSPSLALPTCPFSLHRYNLQGAPGGRCNWNFLGQDPRCLALPTPLRTMTTLG